MGLGVMWALLSSLGSGHSPLGLICAVAVCHNSFFQPENLAVCPTQCSNMVLGSCVFICFYAHICLLQKLLDKNA